MKPEQKRAAKLIYDLDLAGTADYRYGPLCNAIARALRAERNAVIREVVKTIDRRYTTRQAMLRAVLALKSPAPRKARSKR